MSTNKKSTSLSVVEAFYESIGSEGFGKALTHMSESAVLEFFGPSEVPIAGRYSGHDEIRTFFERIGENLQVEEFEVNEFIVSASQVAVIGRERSTVIKTGRTFDVPWVQVFDVAGGKIVRLRDYFETASMADAFKAVEPTAAPAP